MNAQKLNSTIFEFTKKKKSNASYYEENWTERKERKEYYQSFTKDKLIAMTEDEFLKMVLWYLQDLFCSVFFFQKSLPLQCRGTYLALMSKK